MINFSSVLDMYPEASAYSESAAAPFIEAANVGFPDSRFADPAYADRGRILYVMHMLTKPPINLSAPYIVAQMGSPRPDIKKPDPWDGTTFGVELSNAVA